LETLVQNCYRDSDDHISSREEEFTIIGRGCEELPWPADRARSLPAARAAPGQHTARAPALLRALSSESDRVERALYCVFSLEDFPAGFPQSFYQAAAVLRVPEMPPARHGTAV